MCGSMIKSAQLHRLARMCKNNNLGNSVVRLCKALGESALAWIDDRISSCGCPQDGRDFNSRFFAGYLM